MSKEAKDKAEELIDKMHGFTKDECILNALTCVDEILELLNNLAKPEYVYFFEKTQDEGGTDGYEEIDFWNEVKQEILNRQ